jgi:hypothetical protein
MAVRGYLYRLLLGAWVGALLCFGAVVAPALFHVLPSEQAGAIVRRVLPILNSYGVGAALLLLFTTQSTTVNRRVWIRMALLGALGMFAALSLFAVSPRMTKLRESAPTALSQLSPDDPIRHQYGIWHGVSSALAAGQLVLALVALGFEPRDPSAL